MPHNSPSASTGAPATGRVLVAEDDRSVRDSLVRALSFEGYEVHTATDGGEAVRLVGERSPDLLIAGLEVADAEESLRQARAAYDAAVEARRLQEQSVSVEQQTFAVGLSTNLVVIQYQNYLAQARSTEVASRGAYIKAKIALQRATGTILDENHVAVDEAYRGNVSRPHSALPEPVR